MGRAGIDTHLRVANEMRTKAQARCAELESALRSRGMDSMPGWYCSLCDNYEGSTPNRQHRPSCPLASDGTSALAAVRLAQRALRDHSEDPTEGCNGCEALMALAEAFGGGE